VKVDPKTNTITVTYSSDKTNPEQIKKAIAAAGFDADEVKATAEAYEKLDGCCKAK
jgi:Heavy-metal-associated domain.